MEKKVPPARLMNQNCAAGRSFKQSPYGYSVLLWGDCRLTLQHAVLHTLYVAYIYVALYYSAVGRLSFVRSRFTVMIGTVSRCEAISGIHGGEYGDAGLAAGDPLPPTPSLPPTSAADAGLEVGAPAVYPMCKYAYIYIDI